MEKALEHMGGGYRPADVEYKHGTCEVTIDGGPEKGLIKLIVDKDGMVHADKHSHLCTPLGVE